MRTVVGGLTAAALVAMWSAWGWGQVFGKNKVTRSRFEWSYLETAHVDVYFYEGGEELARMAGTMIEDAYERLSADLGHELSARVPVILYRSHNDFEETNVILELIGETTGGFTEVFKNRIVVPFEGSYKKLRHVLHHELVHAMQFDMLYGGILESLLTRQYMFRMPLWFAEGMAEYESVGWDTEADMVMRDAVITGYLPPLEHLQGGYLVYKGGQSFFRFVAHYRKDSWDTKCEQSLRNDFVNDKPTLAGFSPKKSHFNRLLREHDDVEFQPQLFVKCLIFDGTNETSVDTSVDVIHLRSKCIHTFPAKFVFLQLNYVELKVGDQVLIRCESFPHEYYLANLLEYNEKFGTWKFFSSALGRMWIMEKNIILFYKLAP